MVSAKPSESGGSRSLVCRLGGSCSRHPPTRSRKLGTTADLSQYVSRPSSTWPSLLSQAISYGGLPIGEDGAAVSFRFCDEELGSRDGFCNGDRYVDG